MRWIAAAGALCVVAACVAQTPPKDGSQSWLLEESDTVQTVVDATWTWAPGTQSRQSNEGLVCLRHCEGKKHVLHSQCDGSCDSDCRVRHKGAFEPVQSYLQNTELAEGLKMFGVAGDSRALAQRVRLATKAKTGVEEYARDPKNAVPFDFRHWNNSPCSYWFKSIAVQVYEAKVTYVLKRLTRQADGTQLETVGPTATETILIEVGIPNTLENAAKPVVACACSIVKDGGSDEYGALLGEDGKETGVVCVSDEGSKLMDGAEVAALGLQLVGQGMDSFTVSVANWPPGCGQITIPPGFEFVCSDGTAQDCLLVSELAILKADWPRGGPLVRVAAADARTLCLEMNQREPSPAKAYTLAMPRDPATLRLARMTNEARFGGPWGQVRLWIYTDRAGVDEIGKVLVPGPTPRMYLRELHKLVQARLFTPDPSSDAKIVANQLLTAYSPDEDALRWFVQWKLQHDRPSALKYLQSSGKALAEHFREGKAEDAASGVVALAAALAAESDEAALVALELLADKALAPHGAALRADPGFGAVLLALTWTSDAGVAGRILDLVDAHPSEAGKFACRNVDPGLPESVRTRASVLGK